MDNRPFNSYEIQDKSLFAFVKREIHNAAVHESFSESRAGIIDIAVSELTSNVIKHAGKGELLVRFSKEKGRKVFEIICLDSGPGIRNVSKSMKDGVSTTRTLGQGLGALQRLSDVFQVYSIVNWGTVCYCKIYLNIQPPSVLSLKMKFGALNVAKPGQIVSGDGFYITSTSNYTKFFMGDGLGHGPEAYDAVQLAITNFKICSNHNPAEILKFIHDPSKTKRGLVGAAVVADHRLNKWTICGVGNIETSLSDRMTTRKYSNHNGIIGANFPAELINHEADLGKHQCLIMSSDGIRSRWELSHFPSILRYDPLMLAAVIYKDHARKNDDMSILIARTS